MKFFKRLFKKEKVQIGSNLQSLLENVTKKSEELERTTFTPVYDFRVYGHNSKGEIAIMIVQASTDIEACKTGQQFMRTDRAKRIRTKSKTMHIYKAYGHTREGQEVVIRVHGRNDIHALENARKLILTNHVMIQK